MFADNPDFYPTPKALAKKMLEKIKGHPKRILEPSAGKGDLVDAILDHFDGYRMGRAEGFCIEADPVLQATLRGNRHTVIDGDFLEFTGPDKFDALVANPPFSEGDKHLLKAIDIMYRGEIVCLLNAETLRNPHTNTRKLLARRLEELEAEIEFIEGAFQDAERSTGVDIALVYIRIENSVDNDLFAGADDIDEGCTESVSDNHELATGKGITEIVAEYNQVVQYGTETIVAFYRNYPKTHKYLTLNDVGGKLSSYRDGKDRTTLMQDAVNRLVADVRVDFWRRVLDLREVRSRMTSKKMSEFEHALSQHSQLDFTEKNIAQFVLNLVGGYEQTLTEAVIEIFDFFSDRHSYRGGENEKNIHYFNGWKTNKSFKVGKRVVVPLSGGIGSSAFYDHTVRRWRLDYGAARELRDIDTVMNYFDGMNGYISLAQAIEMAFSRGETSGFSTYFKFTCHKKGSAHLTFRDENIRRRFNLVACRGKRWLPEDYGRKPYADMDAEEKAVVEAFEGQASYQEHLGLPEFAEGARLMKSAANPLPFMGREG